MPSDSTILSSTVFAGWPPPGSRTFEVTIGNFASPIRGRKIVRAEIELVVARRHHVDAHLVQDVDLVRALVDAGEERRRKRIAGMDEESCALGALALQHRRELGESAAAVALLHAVDVVGLDEAERYRFGQSRHASRR